MAGRITVVAAEAATEPVEVDPTFLPAVEGYKGGWVGEGADLWQAKVMATLSSAYCEPLR